LTSILVPYRGLEQCFRQPLQGLPLFRSAGGKANIGRIGLNYRFGGPVVAKY
jgi:hypothetical protein